MLCFLPSVHRGFSKVREEKQARYRCFCGGLEKLFLVLWKTRGVADYGMHLCTHCETFVVPGLFIPCQKPLASHRNAKRKKQKQIEIFVLQPARSSSLSAVPKDSVCYCQVIFFLLKLRFSVSQLRMQCDVMFWFYRFIVSICSISKTTKRQSGCPYTCKKARDTTWTHFCCAWLHWNF